MPATSKPLPSPFNTDTDASGSLDYSFDEVGGSSHAYETDRGQQVRQLGQAPSATSVLNEQESTTTDQLLQLIWPDSEDLLQSILSAELGPWPLLETLPSHSILMSGHQTAEQVTSPWLTPSGVEGGYHGGSHAVRNLSQIISNLVGSLLSLLPSATAKGNNLS